MHKYMIVGLFALSSSFVMTMQLVPKKSSSLTTGAVVVRRKSDPKFVATVFVAQQLTTSQAVTVSPPVSIVRPRNNDARKVCIDFSPAGYQSKSCGQDFSPYSYYGAAYNGLGDQAYNGLDDQPASFDESDNRR